MSTLFGLLLLLGSFQSFEDNSYTLQWSHVRVTSGCVGAICQNRPELPELNSPFRCTGETCNYVPPLPETAKESPIFQHFLTEDNE